MRKLACDSGWQAMLLVGGLLPSTGWWPRMRRQYRGRLLWSVLPMPRDAPGSPGEATGNGRGREKAYDSLA